MGTLAAQDTQREQLANGVTLIVREAHLTPVVTVSLAVKAGAVYEGDLLGSGVSTLLWQIKSRELPDDIRQMMATHGFDLSGEVTRHISRFSIETTQEHVEAAITTLCKIARYQDYNEAGFERQRLVLLQKQAQAAGRIDDLIALRLHQALYQQAALNLSPLGKEAPLQALQFKDVLAYDQRRYVSGHVYLLVHGNVATGHVEKAAKAAAQLLPQGFSARAVEDYEPPMLSSRSITIERITNNPELILAWRTVGAEHLDHHVLDMMAAYLNAPESPLRRALIDEQLAAGLQVRHHKILGVPGYLEIRIQLRSEDQQALLSKIGTVLADLQDKPLSSAQVDQIRLHLQRQALVLNQEIGPASQHMLFWELVSGVPDYLDKHHRIRQRVKPKHIQLAAREYLRSSRSCKLHVKNIGDTVEVDEPIVAPQPITKVPPQLKQLDNGVQVVERPLPIGLVHIVLSIGLDTVDDRRRGINALLAKMLTLRTGTRNKEDLTRLLAQKGMQLQSSSSSNAIHIQMTCFSQDTLLAIGLLADCITRPNFQESDLEGFRQQMIASLAVEDTEKPWRTVLRQQTIKMLLADHYASQELFGSIKTLKDIDVKALHDQVSRLVRGGNIVVSIYGSYDEEKTKSFLRQHLSNARIFPKGDRLQPLGTAWQQQQSRSGSVLGPVEAMAIAWRAPAFNDPLIDKVAMDVAFAMMLGFNGEGGALGKRLSAAQVNPLMSSEMNHEAFHQRGIWLWLLRVEPGQGPSTREHIFSAIKSLSERLAQGEEPVFESLLKKAKEVCATKALLNDSKQADVAREHARILLQRGNLDLVSNYRQLLEQVTIAHVKRVVAKFMDEPAAIIQMAPRVLEKSSEPIPAPGASSIKTAPAEDSAEAEVTP